MVIIGSAINSDCHMVYFTQILENYYEVFQIEDNGFYRLSKFQYQFTNTLQRKYDR